MQNTLNVDLLNANCGVGQIPAPRLPQGRRRNVELVPGTVSPALYEYEREPDCLSVGRASPTGVGRPSLQVARSVELSTRRRGPYVRSLDAGRCGRHTSDCGPDSGVPAAVPRRACRRRSEPVRCGRVREVRFRPEFRRDYPLNLSILLSGGKETNWDSHSNGE